MVFAGSLTTDISGEVWPLDDRDTPEITPVDVVIPARNEADTVGNIVTAFRHHPFIGNVIVVCNQCTDLTYETAFHSGAFVLEWNKAAGKGQALQYGLDYVESERVIFCDADLKGPVSRYISELTKDYEGQIIGVPDYPEKSPVPWVVPYTVWREMAGVRNVPANVARGLQLHGYTVETQLNKAIKEPPRYVRMQEVYGKIRNNAIRMAELRRDREWLMKNGR